MAIAKPNLPMIPGYTFNSNVGRENFGIRQYFELFKENGKESRFFFQKSSRSENTLYSKSRIVPSQPAWLVFEKEALVFDAFYQNTLDEMRYGPALLRKVKIFFYLEDGTMKIVEPRTLNSSHLQGTLLSRQRVPLPKTDNVHFDILDLNVGREVDIYGKKFMLADCDKFTRLFLNRLGIQVPDPIEFPKEPCPRKGRKMPSIIGVETKCEKQFFKFDRQVLKFRGYWDNRESEGGKVVHLDIFYYLSDDTIEIKQILTNEDSSDMKSMFLKRGKLPKQIPLCLMSADVMHKKPFEAFRPADLLIGAPLNVYGRMVILTSCDGFTKEYYRVNYGLDNFDPIEAPVPLIKPTPLKQPRPLPPWNGIGTFQDSARNCKSLQPKVSTQNFVQFFTKDKFGFNSHILRFRALLTKEKGVNIGPRHFMIKYFLNDDTMAVNELRNARSTYPGDKFFKRAPIILPNESLYVSLPPKTYKKEDMWVGNVIIINKHHFQLIEADEYTLRYMELNSQDFPRSDIRSVMAKVRERLLSKENYYKEFVSKTKIYLDTNTPNRISRACFETALKEVLCEYLTEHELLTIVREFEDPVEDIPVARSYLRTLIYEELLRNVWQDFDRLCEYIRYVDEDNSGVISHKDLWKALKAVKIPLSNDKLNEILDCVKKDFDGDYYIDDFMDFINFKLNPPLTFVNAPSKYSKKQAIDETYINWDAFLKFLSLENFVNEND